jgi:hypothetical protein
VVYVHIYPAIPRLIDDMTKPRTVRCGASDVDYTPAGAVSLPLSDGSSTVFAAVFAAAAESTGSAAETAAEPAEPVVPSAAPTT